MSKDNRENPNIILHQEIEENLCSNKCENFSRDNNPIQETMREMNHLSYIYKIPKGIWFS